ncbi:plasma-membrane proton-efflux P-type ATPase [Acidianus ambivalens]|uniref:Plasma-membrane proton-efflux P-type ATPase n=1 Tax=Acidianus ambivalens TaxID=2283 RepID=A0A650CVQ8_ACIAM|nr:plasma-membrane proton-efflux P-type ATPase [Acidianus ambivalens]MQL55909.1 plasma-membrane proton-efflux P-type ATPase [Acidianus ambivalens]QGR21527.1 plasma-membrane proton-efflux P-type ATPase [Acidianus ambivalens]
MASNFEKMSIEETLTQLNTSLKGLTEKEAEERIKKYGYNEVKEKKESPIIKFLKKFWAPVPWMLEITIVITYILGKYLDMYIILFLLVFNSIVSFIQERRAENAVELLKQKLNVKARVLRDDQWKVIPARLLVPGDVVHIRLGDIVPADIKLFEGEVLVDQSALTGESVPVEKGKGNVVYSGSIIRRGEASGIVIATGAKTYFGKTTELVQTAKAESHLEKLIMNIVKYLIIVDVALVIALFVFSLAVGVKLSDVLPFSLIVLIASVPVALPATFTIAMALGSQELARKGILVTRLTASEDAASMDVLNLDKTGTITENRMRVGDPIPAEGFTKEEVVKYAYMASDEASQDPIDTAVIACLRENNIAPGNYERLEFKPFDPSTKRTEAIVKTENNVFRVVKGAPQVIAELAEVPDLKSYYSTLEELSKRGYRTISVAIGDKEGKLKLVGILPLYDRPRKDSREFIEEIKRLNVKPKMVTGDNELIAREIARQVGIGDVICNINEIKKLEGKERIKKVEECDVFAEVFPEDKYFIVKTLQEGGHYVGMTGDGVNDAPALKQAEVGIAVANATDVAKASASMVLTHEGLIDIVEAIKTGRRIYQRMLTYTINKIIKTLQVVLFLTLSFFIVRFFVTTPFDVILLLFANDFVTMSIATDNVRYSQKPERLDAGKIVKASLILAFLVVAESFFSLWLALYLRMSINEIHTFIFDMLVFTGQFTVYMVRERRSMWSSRPSNFLLISSIFDIIFISTISVLGILVYPIPLQYVLLILGVSFGFTVIFDHIKNISFKTVGI